MANNDLNIQLYQLLSDWNPMHFDDKTLGDAEVYEMMDAVHQIGNPSEIANAFQNIYRFSFEETLPYDVCLEKAHEATYLQQQCNT
ncbi:MAG: DUF1871 family protein [Staphylococcus hyicus]|uniref:DUF1871 family protein n=1 Tax=Staphylococcus hyicus TaxID=1284 RepID=UPI0027387F60|nr:DUF1871 family protein [Staphylococcus hyicus]MDP4460315.1 DUF1871 family protein [Staphylococcus hyicus]MDY3696998.1 DUF1871 family protein [Staphylococcus hyicus]